MHLLTSDTGSKCYLSYEIFRVVVINYLCLLEAAMTRAVLAHGAIFCRKVAKENGKNFGYFLKCALFDFNVLKFRTFFGIFLTFG